VPLASDKETNVTQLEKYLLNSSHLREKLVCSWCFIFC